MVAEADTLDGKHLVSLFGFGSLVGFFLATIAVAFLLNMLMIGELRRYLIKNLPIEVPGMQYGE